MTNGHPVMTSLAFASPDDIPVNSSLLRAQATTSRITAIQ
jgi:hypothetical protein